MEEKRARMKDTEKVWVRTEIRGDSQLNRGGTEKENEKGKNS